MLRQRNDDLIKYRDSLQEGAAGSVKPTEQPPQHDTVESMKPQTHYEFGDDENGEDRGDMPKKSDPEFGK